MCNIRRNGGCGCDNGIAQVLETAKCEAKAAAASVEQAEKEIKRVLEAIVEAIAITEEENGSGDCDCNCNYCQTNGNDCGCMSYRDFCNSGWCSRCSC